ncbi:unnamed protein product [Rotaria socialis]|uniref:Uncharacterized protein n=1 Tax=Rotaria socialis TaxID=392032 RepID=A0A818H7F2_9BILA|nr:unnamed protein product [Rotaria socialis]
MTTITQLEDLSNEIFLIVVFRINQSSDVKDDTLKTSDASQFIQLILIDTPSTLRSAVLYFHYNHSQIITTSIATTNLTHFQIMFYDAIPGHDILNVATITKVVRQAYNAAAADRLSCFKVKNFLNTKKITNIKEANNCMESSLRKRVNIQDYSDFNEEDEPSDSENESDEMFDSESDVDREDQQYEASTISSDGLFGDLDGIKFSGRGVFGKVLEKSDLNWKSIGRKNVKTNKQTACWIVTQNKSVLSNDGVTRAIQK